ncbi:MAG: hypothetical protein ACYDCQ_17400, partial [Dehalococcoidia bacterium]
MTASGAGTGNAGATTRAPARREVTVNGRRVRVVDLHAHCAIPEAMALLGRENRFPALLLANVAQRLSAMDQQGIDLQALSINPYWYEARPVSADRVIRLQNERLAE